MLQELERAVNDAAAQKFEIEVQASVERTDPVHGDFATNVAMHLAGKLGKSPREIAGAICEILQNHPDIAEVQVAGPGFINIRINDQKLFQATAWDRPQINQSVLLEYSCPNAFKELHTGHLYQTLIGDSMGRIYEFCNARVVRTSFGGDVGLHAAKCMWGILYALGAEDSKLLEQIDDRPAWISQAYVNGSARYESDAEIKSEIDALNKRIYDLFSSGDKDSEFAKIYFTCRQWSYDYFDKFYESILAKPFDRYYPESETMEPGLAVVRKHMGSVFSESEGAVVLNEEKTGLHTRVFITSAGLPTYETKDLGVIQLETSEFNYDRRVIMTGNDQSEYMKVVFAALSLIDPALGSKQRHAANGTVRFGDGTKMSSRLGNVSKATDVINAVTEAVEGDNAELKRAVGLGAVKYSLLKNRVGGDIAFDLEQSISTEGNSGPYLQYALVRARSILRKIDNAGNVHLPDALDEHERQLASKLTEMPEILLLAIEDFSPHHLCAYLYELAGSFNRFYENSRVIDDPRSALRAQLVRQYEQTLSQGLELLGIPAPEAM